MLARKLCFAAALSFWAFPGSASANADTPPPAGTSPAANDALAEKIHSATADHDYRTALAAVDELLARPGGEYSPVLQAWLAVRYGDLRRGASILLPLVAKKNEFRKTVHESFEPLILGSLAFHTGDRDRARELLRKAVDQFDMRQAQSDFAYPLMMQALDLLGQLHRERGEHRAAAQCIQELRELLKLRGYKSEHLVLADLHQAELHLAKGDVARAAESLKLTERYLEAQHALPKAIRARILVNMGVVATRHGETREARRLYEETLSLQEAVFIDFHPAIIDTLRHLTNLHVAMGKNQEALVYASKAAEKADKRARHLLSMGSERQKRISARHIEHDTDTVVSLHLQHAPTDVAAARLALTTILRRKGMVFEAMLGGVSSLRENLDAEGKALARELTDLSAQMSTMISRGPIDVTLDDYQNDLFDLEEHRRALEERLIAHANRAKKSRFDDEPLVQLAEVQQHIPEGAALVELFEYRPHRPFGPPIHPTWGKTRVAAYVLHKTGDPQWTDLGPANTIATTATKLVHELSASGPHRPLARQLDALVMQPIRKALGTTRWTLLSPDGALNFVPFYALVDENDRELVETMSLTYLMTGRDLLRLGSSAAARQDAVIVANPDFGKTIEAETNEVTMAQSRAVDLSRVFFSQLQGTEEEGLQVQKTMSKALLLAGANATEEAIKQMHGPRILHIATHGFFLPDITNITGDTSKTGPDPWNANPLLRSGLALHGANRRKSETDREDGVLTALEVSNLDLQGTRLVVLSACETGVGQALHGEGVYGLQRAMMIAGAETQVTSLWQVDDNATKNLMVKFYEELARGTGRGEAMRMAQLAVKKSYPHPFYWASFIVTGSGATLDGNSLAPDPKNMQVSPTVRGCGCKIVDTQGSKDGTITVLLGIALWGAHRRRKSRGGHSQNVKFLQKAGA